MKKIINKIIIISLIVLTLVSCSYVNETSSIKTTEENNVSVKYLGPYTNIEYKKEYYAINNTNELSIILPKEAKNLYGELFFEDKGLIAFLYKENSEDSRTIIDSYTIENGELLINTNTVELGESSNTGYWWFILEINKNLLNIINQVKTINNQKIITYISNDAIEKYSNMFDLTEEKDIWNGDITDISSCDKLYIVLKKTNLYPEFKIEYLENENVISFEYVRKSPPDYFYETQYKDLLDKFRQMVCINLTTQTVEELIDVIREIEKISYVKGVYPISESSPA